MSNFAFNLTNHITGATTSRYNKQTQPKYYTKY